MTLDIKVVVEGVKVSVGVDPGKVTRTVKVDITVVAAGHKLADES